MSKASLVWALTNAVSPAGSICTLSTWCHWKKAKIHHRTCFHRLPITPYSSMPLFSTTLFHPLPSTTFIILWWIHIFLNLNIFLCGTCSFPEVPWQVTLISYVNKINYWKDEFEQVQLDVPLINTSSIFHLSPGPGFSINLFSEILWLRLHYQASNCSKHTTPLQELHSLFSNYNILCIYTIKLLEPAPHQSY